MAQKLTSTYILEQLYVYSMYIYTYGVYVCIHARMSQMILVVTDKSVFSYNKAVYSDGS